MESRLSLIFLFIVMRISAAEVVKKNLTGTVGGTITLPEPLLEKGFLLFRGKNVALVRQGELDILEEIYIHRLHWNKTSGNVSLTNLQRNDSGIYTLDNKGQKMISFYKLTVYDAVPTPSVIKSNVSSNSCSLMCSVDGAEETTLSWYRDEKIVIQNNSAVSLPLTVLRRDFKSSHRCVATNPAQEKTLEVDVKTSCGHNDTENRDDKDKRHHKILIGIIISIVCTVVLIPAVLIFKWKYIDQKKMTTRETQESVDMKPEVEYTEVIHKHDNKRSQGETLPDSTGNIDRSNLTTVYDKLESHRMAPKDPVYDV
ncbi:T-lymphocyte surface antigen Ly-9-like isoform X1 [Embiotoca jacksoni]|uniref:T-lymphocyte surface antigen Ly-9-like isoform X1 n=1 Tax=Embiotoca jacksoni TaxID=100190 RepID=UPI003704CAC4